MKEITMITTCEVTVIETFSDKDVEQLVFRKDEFAAKIREFMKEDLNCDDVNILNCQLFVRDVPNQ